MADFMLRNLDDDLKEKLRKSAARNGRSMNAELRDTVRIALNRPRQVSGADFSKLAADIRKLSNKKRQTPSEDLLCEGRIEP